MGRRIFGVLGRFRILDAPGDISGPAELEGSFWMLYCVFLLFFFEILFDCYSVLKFVCVGGVLCFSRVFSCFSVFSGARAAAASCRKIKLAVTKARAPENPGFRARRAPGGAPGGRWARVGVRLCFFYFIFSLYKILCLLCFCGAIVFGK